MKQISVPDDLTSMSDEDLNELASEIRSAAEELVEEAASTDEALAEIEALAASFDEVQAEISAREARKAEREERAAAALNKLHGDDDSAVAAAEEEADDDASEEDDEADEVEDAPVAIAASTESEAVAAVEEPAEEAEEVAEAPVEVEYATETITHDPQVEASAETAVATPEDAVSDSLSTSTAVAALDADRPDAMAPREESSGSAAPLVSSNAVPGFGEGVELSTGKLAQAIADKRHGFGRVSAGTSERIVLATAQTDLPYKVGGSEVQNFEVFEQMRRDWRDARSKETALVAAGGVCAPLEPSYEFFRLAEAVNPVESSLAVAEAPRGGIRFIVPPDWTDVQSGVRVTTEEEDAAGYPPTEPKPCVTVECPQVEECRVDAVSQCVTFGNLNYRVFPEQVEAFLADLAVAFTQTKEIFYLDAIDAASTPVTAAPTYGAVRGLTHTILAAAANYRRRHHMAPESTLSVYLPSWVVEFVKVDLINDHSMGLGFIGASQADVDRVFASMNIDITWYYDSATGAGQAFNAAQGAGALNEFPSTVVAYLFAPGTFVRLNAGVLDLGVVRDSTLNGTNDLQIFSEEWIQVCMVGIESLRLEISLCPDGTAPEPVTPLECGAASV